MEHCEMLSALFVIGCLCYSLALMLLERGGVPVCVCVCVRVRSYERACMYVCMYVCMYDCMYV